MTAYNPIVRCFEFTTVYASIIADELSNDNARRFYRIGWNTHRNAVAALKEDYLEFVEDYANTVLAVALPSIQFAVAAYAMIQNRHTMALPAATTTADEPIDGELVDEAQEAPYTPLMLAPAITIVERVIRQREAWKQFVLSVTRQNVKSCTVRQLKAALDIPQKKRIAKGELIQMIG